MTCTVYTPSNTTERERERESFSFIDVIHKILFHIPSVELDMAVDSIFTGIMNEKSITGSKQYYCSGIDKVFCCSV